MRIDIILSWVKDSVDVLRRQKVKDDPDIKYNKFYDCTS